VIDSLKSENTVLFDIIDSLEKKLEKFSSENLKSIYALYSFRYF
jgi:hypothetical protein